MTTVSMKGKCDWVLQTEYGVRTIFTYLCFGVSLGMVQIRHNLRNCSVYCHEMVRRTPRLPDANKRRSSNNVFCKEEISMSQSEQIEFFEMLLHETIKLMQLTQRESVHVRLINLFARQEKALCANTKYKTQQTHRNVEETSNCVFGDVHSGSNNGHGQGNKTKNKVWVNTEITVDMDENVKTKTEEEYLHEIYERNALFLLSRNDPAYAKSIAEHKPVVLSYRDGLYLHHVLSQVIGWELFLLHRTQESVTYNNVHDVEVLHSTELVELHTMSSHKRSNEDNKKEIRERKEKINVKSKKYNLVDESCVAMMLPNCVEYNIIWLSCAQAGVMHTFLDALYSHSSTFGYSRGNSKQESNKNKNNKETSNSSSSEFVYHPCCVALINTNLTNNAMMFHALECVSSELVILDVAYAGLLFDTVTDNTPEVHSPAAEEEEQTVCHDQPVFVSSTERSTETNIKMNTETKWILHVPTCVKRIYLWRWNGKFTSSFTQEMAMQLNAFHQAQYTHIASINSVTQHDNNINSTMSVNNFTNHPLLSTNIQNKVVRSLVQEHTLDLFSYVSSSYSHFTQCSTPFSQTSLEDEVHHFTYLTSHIIAYPPQWMAQEQCTSLELVHDGECTNPLSCNAHWTNNTSNSNSISQSINELESDTNKTETNSINDVDYDSNDDNKDEHNNIRNICQDDITITNSFINNNNINNNYDQHNFTTNTVYSDNNNNTVMVSDSVFVNSTAPLRRRFSNPLTQTYQSTEQHCTTRLTTSTRKTQCNGEDDGKECTHTSKRLINHNLDESDEHAPIMAIKLTTKQVTKFYKKLRAALNLFHYTHPILYIYTSGTTGGLPKAAKFSHLRFFATCYLSRVLHFREKTSIVWQTQYRKYENEAKANSHSAELHHKKDNNANNKEQWQNVQTYYNSANNERNVSLTHEHKEETSVYTAFEEVVGQVNDNHDNDHHHTGETDNDKINNKADNVHENEDTHHNCIICALHAVWKCFVAIFVTIVHFLHYVFSCRQRDDRKEIARHALQHELDCLTVYVCLPMYHTVGCVFCLGHLMHALEEQHAEQVKQRRWNAITHPFTHCRSTSAQNRKEKLVTRVPTARLLLRSKFSTSQFTLDCQQYHVTVVQYIGEVLRYALQSAEKKASVNNTNNMTLSSTKTSKEQVEWLVPYAFGNGLRKDIWHDVMELLHIAQPVEFYSSTEGNVFLFNLYNIPGVIGHIARLPGPINYILGMHYFPAFPFRVVKYDDASQDIWRDAHSHYSRRVHVNEVGEILGEIVSGFDLFALRRFDGYHSINGVDVHGSQKIITHVLWPFAHTTFFRSGDLVMFDKFGFCTFVDRVGDTFRWKGENVSTVEVSNALHTITGTRVKVEEAIVYGVTVPLCEGRAGMALFKLQHCHYTKKNVNKNQNNNGNSMNRNDNNADMMLHETDLQPVTLNDERLFLQNEFYKCLNGQSLLDVDSVMKPIPLLPSYAIPLFIRIDDHIMSDSESHSGESKSGTHDDKTSNIHNKTTSITNNNKTKENTDTHMTTTFKYRKFVLIKENYMLHLNDNSDWDCNDLSAIPSSRIYILVKNRAVIDQLAIEPRPDAKCNGAYLPLTRRTLELIGSNFTNCGW